MKEKNWEAMSTNMDILKTGLGILVLIHRHIRTCSSKAREISATTRKLNFKNLRQTFLFYCERLCINYVMQSGEGGVVGGISSLIAHQ